jgi:hypothetical protein
VIKGFEKAEIREESQNLPFLDFGQATEYGIHHNL